MQSLFHFNDYKEYVVARLKSMPSKGKGQFTRIAEELKTHTSLLSHIFKGSRHLSLEQGCIVAKYLGLDSLETEYFLILIQLARSETEALKKVNQRLLERLRDQAIEPESSTTANPARTLSEQDRATFYSNWYYSGVRLLSSIPKYDNRDSIAEYFGLPQQLVRQVIEFLLATGLCVEREGRLQMGPRRTFVEPDSPHFSRHHINWRLKAIERMPRKGASELFGTIPTSLAAADIPKVRAILLEMIEKVQKSVEDSEAEKLACLNVDWFVV